MFLTEAADLFKQIVQICPGLDGRKFLIMIPEQISPDLAEGYEVIIRKNRAVIDEKTILSLRDIATEHHLKILETENSIAIYTPSSELAQFKEPK